jgi:hypothetical protein
MSQNETAPAMEELVGFIISKHGKNLTKQNFMQKPPRKQFATYSKNVLPI